MEVMAPDFVNVRNTKVIASTQELEKLPLSRNIAVCILHIFLLDKCLTETDDLAIDILSTCTCTIII